LGAVAKVARHCGRLGSGGKPLVHSGGHRGAGWGWAVTVHLARRSATTTANDMITLPGAALLLPDRSVQQLWRCLLLHF